LSSIAHAARGSADLLPSRPATRTAPETLIVFVRSGAEGNPPFSATPSIVEELPRSSHDASAIKEIVSLLRSRYGDLGSVAAVSLIGSSLAARAELREEQEVLTFSGLRIDARRRKVFIDDEERRLTKSEFDLLSVLARRPGVVFSRREIVLAYKGADYPVDDRSIDVQMVNLRRKLGPVGRYLQTIRGVGYRFVESGFLPSEEHR